MSECLPMKLNSLRFRPTLFALVTCSALLAAFPESLSAKKGAPQPLEDTPAEAQVFLDRFQGEWTGSGDFEGSPIADALAIERILGDLYMQIRQDDLLGDFEAHMYFGFDALDEQYELYVFGSFTGFGGNLPVRVMSGHRFEENLLIVEEKEEKGKAAAKQLLRYTFEFLDDQRFVLSKTWITGKKGEDEPFVVELFERDR